MPVDTHEDIMPAAGIESPDVVETHEDIKPAMGMTAYHGSPLESGDFTDKTEKIVKMTDTPNFKKWFEGSKAIDEKGEPLVLYHGTRGDFSSFDPKKANSEGGAFFFSKDAYTKPGFDARNAATYASGAAGNIMPVHLKMKNPYITGFTNPIPEYGSEKDMEKWVNDQEEFDKKFDDDNFKASYFRNAIKTAKKNGHDSVIIKGVTDDQYHNPIFSQPSDIHIVFEPNQIKSATGNIGNYDPESDDITKAYGGAIAGPKLTEENAEDFARRLILWSYAAAPFVNRSIRRATGGEVDPSVDQALAAARGASQADPAASATETARSLTPMGFYSAAAEAASKIPQRAPIDQILNKVKGSPGVKAEELDWSGVKDAFAGQRSVDPQEVARHLQANLPALQETVKYDPSDIARKLSDQRAALMWHGRLRSEEDEALRDKITQTYNPSWRRENAAIYGEYTIPDGANYREVLLHLPKYEPENMNEVNDKRRDIYKKTADAMAEWKRISEENEPGHPDTLAAYKRFYELRKEKEKVEEQFNDLTADSDAKNYKSSHWNVPNVVAHLRLSDRDMGKTLHMEELQSDWGQEKRDGEKLPDAPHISSNEGWTDLGLKRALLEAAKGGYKELIWTPGQEQADRYDLSSQVKHIMWSPDNKILSALTHDNSEAIGQRVEKEDLHKYIGKEAAKKLLDQEPEMDGNMATHHLRGQAISVGGEGMKNFYDRFLPGRLQKLISKLDPEAKVQLRGHKMFVPDEEEGDSDEGEYKSVHSLEITPKLRAAILKGLPAYKDGGSIVNKALDVISGLRR